MSFFSVVSAKWCFIVIGVLLHLKVIIPAKLHIIILLLSDSLDPFEHIRKEIEKNLILILKGKIAIFHVNMCISCCQWGDYDCYQMSEHPEDSCFFLTIGFIFFWRTVLIASSNTPFNPSCVSALHSMYLHLNSSSITFRAVSFIMGASLGSFFITAYSSLKSILFPTKILGTLPTFSCSSGYHLVWAEVLFCVHWRRKKARWLRRRWGRHRNWDRQVGVDDCTLLGLQYPTVPSWSSAHPPWPWLHSYRTRLAHTQWGTCLECSCIYLDVPYKKASFSDWAITDNN